MILPQHSPSNQTHELTRSKANDRPRETRHAEESVYWLESLRCIHSDVIRQEDEEIDEDFRGHYDRGKDVKEDGDDDQEWREEGEEDGVEEPDEIRKGC